MKQLKRVTALVLSLALVITLIPQTARASETEPGKNKDGYYELGTEADWEWFASQVNGGMEKDQQKAVLINDITETGDYVPVGTVDHPFTGELDGKNHFITMSQVKEGEQACWGLFGVNEGLIHDLKIKGDMSSKGNYTGSLAGKNQGTITNVVSEVTITLTGTCKPSGGIAGGNYGTITACKYSGNLTIGSQVTSATQLGGIAGCSYENSSVIGCVFGGKIEGNISNASIGGITGRIDGNGVKLQCSYGTGDISGTNTNAWIGGLVGIANKIQDVVISNCYTRGNITAQTSSQGPLIGKKGNQASGLEPVNCCYLKTAESDEKGLTQEQLKEESTLTLLNTSVIELEKWCTYLAGDEGYPVLSWEKGTEPDQPDKPEEPVVVPVEKLVVMGAGITGGTLQAVATDKNDTPATKVSYQWQIKEEYEDEFGEVAEEWTNLSAVTDKYQIPDEKESFGQVYRVTAVGENNSSAVSNEIKVTEKSAHLMLQEAVEKLTLAETKILTQKKLSLPSVGQNGAAITWASDKPEYIANDGTVVALPETETVKVSLTATLSLLGETANKVVEVEVYSKDAAKEDAFLESVKEAFSFGVLKPEYGIDTNVTAFLDNQIKKKGFQNVTVSLASTEKSTYPNGGEASIGQDGTLTYFYADPLKVSQAPYYNSAYGQFTCSFQLSYGNSTQTLEKTVQLGWNQDKLVDSLKTEIADKVTWETIKGSNEGQEKVSSPLTLPRYVGGKDGGNLLCELKWTTDAEKNLVISDGEDSIYGDYAVEIRPEMQEKNVHLTLELSYKKAEGAKEEAAVKKLNKTFSLTILPKNVDEQKKQMAKELEDNYTIEKLTDSISGEKINPEQVKGDIQLLTPAKTGISNAELYQFTGYGAEDGGIKVNGYRAVVYRPLPGDSTQKAEFTIRMALRSNDQIYVEKKFVVNLIPLQAEELLAEKKLMKDTIANYFNGINKGANASVSDISKSLTSFQEAYYDTNQQLAFAYSWKDVTSKGVYPESYIENTSATGSDDQYTYFNSSNPALIEKSTLRLLAKPTYDTEVTLDSYLSSRYGKYYTKLVHEGKLTQAEQFRDLYRQHAQVKVIVKGTSGGSGTQTSTTVGFQIKSDNGIWLDWKYLTVTNQISAGDLAEQIMKQEGFKYEGSMAYIQSITNPQGMKLAELDQGPNSGWMYRVNGILPKVPLNQYYLKNGDNVCLFYTKDFTKEEENNGGGGNSGGGSSSGFDTPASPNLDLTANQTEDVVQLSLTQEQGDSLISTLSDKNGELSLALKNTNERKTELNLPGKFIDDLTAHASFQNLWIEIDKEKIGFTKEELTKLKEQMTLEENHSVQLTISNKKDISDENYEGAATINYAVAIGANKVNGNLTARVMIPKTESELKAGYYKKDGDFVRKKGTKEDQGTVFSMKSGVSYVVASSQWIDNTNFEVKSSLLEKVKIKMTVVSKQKSRVLINWGPKNKSEKVKGYEIAVREPKSGTYKKVTDVSQNKSWVRIPQGQKQVRVRVRGFRYVDQKKIYTKWFYIKVSGTKNNSIFE